MSRRGQKRAVHPAPLELKYKKTVVLFDSWNCMSKERNHNKKMLFFAIQSNYTNKFISQVICSFSLNSVRTKPLSHHIWSKAIPSRLCPSGITEYPPVACMLSLCSEGHNSTADIWRSGLFGGTEWREWLPAKADIRQSKTLLETLQKRGVKRVIN